MKTKRDKDLFIRLCIHWLVVTRGILGALWPMLALWGDHKPITAAVRVPSLVKYPNGGWRCTGSGVERGTRERRGRDRAEPTAPNGRFSRFLHMVLDSQRLIVNVDARFRLPRELPLQLCHICFGIQLNQVRRAPFATVACAESYDRNRRTAHLTRGLTPPMFERISRGRVYDSAHLRVGQQPINVPVLPFASTQMAFNARSQSTRAERAPNVNIIAPLERERAEPSDPRLFLVCKM